MVHHLACAAEVDCLDERGPDSARATGNSQTGTVCFAYQYLSVSPDALWYVGRSRALPYDRLHAVGRRRDRPGRCSGVLHDLYFLIHRGKNLAVVKMNRGNGETVNRGGEVSDSPRLRFSVS